MVSNVVTEEAVWGSWTSFGNCDVTCGDGTRTRTRTCKPNPVCPDCKGADCRCNGEYLQTDDHLGYVVVDFDISGEFDVQKLDELKNIDGTLRARILDR